MPSQAQASNWFFGDICYWLFVGYFVCCLYWVVGVVVAEVLFSIVHRIIHCHRNSSKKTHIPPLPWLYRFPGGSCNYRTAGDCRSAAPYHRNRKGAVDRGVHCHRNGITHCHRKSQPTDGGIEKQNGKNKTEHHKARCHT